MSKVKANLIKVNVKLGNLKLAVHIALLNNLEGGNQVYLDNAYSDVAFAMTRHQFAGYLAALQKDGVYQTQGDDFFGTVVIKNNAE